MSESIELKRKRAMAIAIARDKDEAEAQSVPEEKIAVGSEADPFKKPSPTMSKEEEFKQQLESGRKQAIGEISEEEMKARQAGVAEGIPGAKHLGTAVHTLQNTGLDNFGEEYYNNLSELEDEMDTQKANNPSAFMQGELGGGIAASTLVPSAKGAMLFGAASQVSRLDSDEITNPFQVASAATIGAGTTGAFVAGGKLIGWVGRKIGALATNATKEGIGAFGGGDLKKLNRHIRKTGSPEKTMLENTRAFSNRVANTMVDGEPLLGKPGVKSALFDDVGYEQIANRAKKAMESHGKRLGDVVDTIDDAFVENFKGKTIQGNALYNRMKTRLGINKMLKSNDPKTVQLGQDLLDDLDDQFILSKGQDSIKMGDATQLVRNPEKDVYRTFTPKEIHQLKIDRASTSRTVSSGFEKMGIADKARSLGVDELYDTELNSLLNETMEGASKAVAKTHPQLAGSYKAVNRDYSDMIMVHKIARNQADAASGGPMEALKRALAVRGLLVAQLQGGTGMAGPLASIIGASVNQTISNPTTGIKATRMLTGFRDFAVANPDNHLVKRVLLGAQVSMSAPMLNNMPLKDALSSAYAEITLMQAPIGRTYADIEDKSDAILEAMQHHDPDSADRLRTLFKAGDEEGIRAMANEISKMPEMKNYFEKGRGIDGRVYTPEEKEMLLAELNKMDISLDQKIKLGDALMKEGIIPVIKEEKERFFKRENRDKDKPRY